MYRITNLFTHRPVEISAVIVGWVNFCVIMNWVHLTPVQVGGLNIVLVPTLGLFVKANTTTNVGIAELQGVQDDAHAAGVQAATDVVVPAVQAVVNAIPSPAPVIPEPHADPHQDPPVIEDPLAPPARSVPRPAKKAVKKASPRRR